MSNSSTTTISEPSSTAGRIARLATFRQGAQFVTGPLRFVAFWAAVALPFLYLPLLFGGLEGDQTSVFLGLLALNAFALVVGHGYGQ
ncbi:MAG: hypothetical protein ABEJ28_01835 [Salinigranum sp.]